MDLPGLSQAFPMSGKDCIEPVATSVRGMRSAVELQAHGRKDFAYSLINHQKYFLIVSASLPADGLLSASFQQANLLPFRRERSDAAFPPN